MSGAGFGLAVSCAETIARNGPSCSSPALASVRSRNARSEFEATASGMPASPRRRQQLDRAGPRLDTGKRLDHHQLDQLVDQLLTRAGALEDRFELARSVDARGADQDPLVLERELPPEAREQRALGARPGLLGVEQQAVVVEHDGLRRHGHDEARITARRIGLCTAPLTHESQARHGRRERGVLRTRATEDTASRRLSCVSRSRCCCRSCRTCSRTRCAASSLRTGCRRARGRVPAVAPG